MGLFESIKLAFSKERLIYDEKNNGFGRHPNLKIFADLDSMKDMKFYIDPLVKNFYSNDLISRFDKVSISMLWEEDENVDAFDLSQRNLAFVIRKEVLRGDNKIYVHWNYIVSLGWKVENETGEPRLKYSIKKLLEVVPHELFHCWQLRIERTSKLIVKNQKRVAKAANNLVKTRKLIIKSRTPYEFYNFMSGSLTNLLYYLVVEGASTFYENLKSGKMDYSLDSILKNHKEAKIEADALLKGIDNQIVAFEKFIDLPNEKVVGDTNLAKFWSEAQGIRSGADEFFKNSVGAGYFIGASIFQIVCYDLNGKITDDKIIEMPYVKLISQYENACKKLGLQPNITLNSNLGIYDHRIHMNLLKQIRKQAKRNNLM